MLVSISTRRPTVDPNKVYSQKEVAQFWREQSAELYKKFGTVRARLAKDGEHVVTEIDGEKETENTAKEGDLVIKGPKGEEYILDAKKFLKRYKGPEPTAKYQEYEAVGSTYAQVWRYKKPIKFTASWGEQMIMKPGDYFCSITKEADGDLYRIEKGAFHKTYKKAKG